jgi:hypothetical protein
VAAAAVSTGEVKGRSDDRSPERCRGGGELLITAAAVVAATKGVAGERIEIAGGSLGDASSREGEGGASNMDGESLLEWVGSRRGVAEPGASVVATEASDEAARSGAKSNLGRCSSADINLNV